MSPGASLVRSLGHGQLELWTGESMSLAVGEGGEYNQPTVFIDRRARRAAKDPGNFNSWSTSVFVLVICHVCVIAHSSKPVFISSSAYNLVFQTSLLITHTHFPVLTLF